LLRRNGTMSAQVCMEAMKSTAPGVRARALHAIADYVFRLEGDCGQAYDFILEPSHPQSETLLDGDLVLVDCAPDHQGYAMDIARIWPVNGVFDEWQRHTCGLIVDYHKTLLSMTRAGVLVADIYKDAAAQMLARYKGDEAGTAILNNMIERGVRYFNHNVGLSAHDAVAPWQEAPLQPGMVLVVDPMVWLDDAPHGYVRVEDTIAITGDGYESLTGSVPFELDEIEELMKQPGRFPLDLA
jgi:Xaa-Pro aminopeptidase